MQRVCWEPPPGKVRHVSEHRPEEGSRLEQEDAQRYPAHEDPETERERAGLADDDADGESGSAGERT